MKATTPPAHETAPDTHTRIMVFIPAYNCAPQIGRVIAQFTPAVMRHVSRLVVIDNRSTDDTLDRARDALAALPADRWLLLRNVENHGLGGSHKVAFDHAIAHGFTHLVVLHGDDQGSIADLLPLLDAGAHLSCDALLGGRFMRGSRLPGYSRLRTALNHLANWALTAITFTRVHDLGAGLNLYRVAVFADRAYLPFIDTLSFNQMLLLHSINAGHRLRFFPLTWREDDQVSNARLARLGVRLARIMLGYMFNRRDLVTRNLGRADGQYLSDTIAGGAA